MLNKHSLCSIVELVNPNLSLHHHTTHAAVLVTSLGTQPLQSFQRDSFSKILLNLTNKNSLDEDVKFHRSSSSSSAWLVRIRMFT